MPQVPIFQGGVPQVRDSGQSGRMVVQAPRISTDYERTFQLALQPLRQGVQEVSKMLEVEQARRVKALSDEVETDYMSRVQDRMYSPENGYLTKQGKTASDDYQSTVDGLRKDMSDILGKQPPIVREAVESRLQDRLSSAELQATRWNNQQTQVWHLQSSESRKESLINDAAQHYGDEEYLSKSWLSVVDELKYQAVLRGWDKDTLSQQTRAHYDLFQSSRYATWAQDDPVSAFSALHAERGRMSEDVYRKMENAAWQAGKGLISYQLQQRYPNGLPGDRVDLSFRTGIPLVDGLSDSRKLEIFSTVKSNAARASSERQTDMRRLVQNSLERVRLEGADPEQLSEDQFIQAYGEQKGPLLYKDYVSDFEMREKVYTFSSITNGEIDDVVSSLRPHRGSENYAVESKNYETALRAAEAVKTARAKDPVGAAIQDPRFGFSPIRDWSQQGSYDQLRVRSENMREVAESYGSKPVLLSGEEEAALKKELESRPPAEQSDILRGLSSAVSEDSQGTLAGQLGDVYGNAFLLTAESGGSDSKVTELYLKGLNGLKTKATQFDGITSHTIGVDSYVPQLMEKLIDNPREREAILNSVTNVAAGLAIERGGYGSLDDIRKATQMIVGDVEEYNGRKVALKDGATLSDLETTIRRLRKSAQNLDGPFVQTAGGKAIAAKDFAVMLITAPLRPAVSGANNTFNVICGNGILFDMNGQPFEVKVIR